MDELLAANSKFDVYTDILKKLANLGIPQNEIRFIHDAKTDLQKTQLFSDMNTSKARIFIGTTQKMGAGTNVQKKIVALHHLDCPWRPSDLEQRTGRVIRQGNELFIRDPENFRIKEFRYATERTYDARMWQVIESKALSIEQFREDGVDVRTLDYISSGAAEATGNPFILMQVQLSSDLRKEELLYNGYQREIFNNEESLKHLEKDLIYKEKELLNLGQIQKIIHNNPIENFSGHYYHHNIVTKEESKHSFNILKDDNSDENKAKQNEVKRVFEKTINSISHNYTKELNVSEYRGLQISGNMDDLNTMVFSISDPNNENVFTQPLNLTYNKNPKEIFPIESLVSFTGFVSRLNNFCSDIDKNIEKRKNELDMAKRNLHDLQLVTGDNTPEYKRKAYLEELRNDNTKILNEIEHLTNDKDYVSTFIPSSYAVLKNMEKSKSKILRDNYLL